MRRSSPGLQALLLALFLAALWPPARTTAQNGPEDAAAPPVQFAGELELEKIIAERLEEILTPLVGRAVVMVDLQLASLPMEMEGFVYSRKESLPGLPVTVSERLKRPEEKGWAFSEVDGIQIRVYVSESMSEADIDRITELIPRWVNLNFSRGDQIIVERVPFIKPPLTLVDLLISTRGLVIFAGALVLIALVVALLVRLLTPTPQPAVAGMGGSTADSGISGPISAVSLAQMMAKPTGSERPAEEEEDSSSGREALGIPVATTLSLPEEGIAVRLLRDADGSRKALGPLARLQDMETPALLSLLRDASPAEAAFALQLARPVTGAGALQAVGEEHRRAIMEAMVALPRLTVNEVERLASSLGGRLRSTAGPAAFLRGAHERIVELINNAPEDAAKALFQDLEATDPELAKAVRGHIFFLEDLAGEDNRILRRVFLGMPREALAVLIKQAPEEVAEAILANLSQRAANLVREEVQLLGDLPPAKAASAKKLLLGALKRAREATP